VFVTGEKCLFNQPPATILRFANPWNYYIFMTVLIDARQVSEKTWCFNKFQDID
jgi:hypothetical protein